MHYTNEEKALLVRSGNATDFLNDGRVTDDVLALLFADILNLSADSPRDYMMIDEDHFSNFYGPAQSFITTLLRSPIDLSKEIQLPLYLKLCTSDKSGFYDNEQPWLKRVFYFFAYPEEIPNYLREIRFDKADSIFALLAIMKLRQIGKCELNVLMYCYKSFKAWQMQGDSYVGNNIYQHLTEFAHANKFKIGMLALGQDADERASLLPQLGIDSLLPCFRREDYEALRALLPGELFECHYAENYRKLLELESGAVYDGVDYDAIERSDEGMRKREQAESEAFIKRILKEPKNLPEMFVSIFSYKYFFENVPAVKKLLLERPELEDLFFSELLPMSTRNISIYRASDYLFLIAKIFPQRIYHYLLPVEERPSCMAPAMAGAGSGCSTSGLPASKTMRLRLIGDNIFKVIKVFESLISEGVPVDLSLFEAQWFKAQHVKAYLGIFRLYQLSAHQQGRSVLMGFSEAMRALGRTQGVIRAFPYEFSRGLMESLDKLRADTDPNLYSQGWPVAPIRFLKSVFVPLENDLWDEFALLWAQDPLQLVASLDCGVEVSPHQAFQVVKSYLNMLQSFGIEDDMANAIKESLFNWHTFSRELDVSDFGEVIALLDRYAVVYYDFTPEDSHVKSNSVAACFLSQRQAASVPTSTEDKISVLEMQKQQLEAVFTDPEPLPLFKRIAVEAQLKEINCQLEDLSVECTAIVPYSD